MGVRKVTGRPLAVLAGLALVVGLAGCSSVPPAVNSVATAYLAACDSNPDATPSPPPYDVPVFGLLTYPNSSMEWPIWRNSNYGSWDGVGWSDNTSGPGEIGNMVVVSVKNGNATESYNSMMHLAVGDEVDITTCSTVFAYVVTTPPSSRTMIANDTWPLDPNPDEPGAAPTVAQLTMIAIPQLDPPVRNNYVGFAELTGTTPR